MNRKDWEDISTDQAYKLSMSEFKGTMIQSLQDIRQDINDIKQDQKVMRWISFGLGGIAGIITSVLTQFQGKHS